MPCSAALNIWLADMLGLSSEELLRKAPWAGLLMKLTARRRCRLEIDGRSTGAIGRHHPCVRHPCVCSGSRWAAEDVVLVQPHDLIVNTWRSASKPTLGLRRRTQWLTVKRRTALGWSL